MKKQRGWTMWSALLAIMLVIYFALLGMKLVPPYMDHLKIKDALTDIALDPQARQMSRNQIIKKMENILYIDFALDVVNLKEALLVLKDKRNMTLQVKYDVIVPLVYNMNALILFDEKVEVE